MEFRTAAFLACFLLTVMPASRDRHYSFWSDDPERYLHAIRSAAPTANPAVPAEGVCGGIVTHHFLASGLMVRFFAGLGHTSPPKTIILIGPNHFHHGLANISISGLPWKTPFGLLEADQDFVRSLSAHLQVSEDPEAFSGEHSIGVLIPFIKYYFPQSRVVPVLVDVNARPLQLRRLREALSQAIEQTDTLLLLSMDFSHNSTVPVADARDREAQRVISGLQASQTSNLHVDSRKGLWLMLESLKAAGCSGVQFAEHSNSARITGNRSQHDVTSYFTVYFFRRPR